MILYLVVPSVIFFFWELLPLEKEYFVANDVIFLHFGQIPINSALSWIVLQKSLEHFCQIYPLLIQMNFLQLIFEYFFQVFHSIVIETYNHQYTFYTSKLGAELPKTLSVNLLILTSSEIAMSLHVS